MQQPAIGRIILNDYVAFLLTIVGPIALALSAFAAAFGFIPALRNRGGQEVDPRFVIGMCAVAAVIAALCLFLLLRRISRIKRILSEGTREKAKVLDIEFVKDRGRIEFEYMHNNQQHKSGIAIMKNKLTTSISTGDEIDVAIDPENSNTALVVQLYCA